MAAQNLANKLVFLNSLLGWTTTGHNFTPRTKNKKDSENIYKNEVNVVGFFRNFDFSKNAVNFNRNKCLPKTVFSIK